MTEPLSDTRDAVLDRLAEAALSAVEPELERLRAVVTRLFKENRALDRSLAAAIGERDHARFESEQRLGELLFWHFEHREAMDNYRSEAQHAKKLRAELASAVVLDRAGLELLMDLLTADRYRMDRGDGVVPQPRWATNVRITGAVHAALDTAPTA